MKLITKEIATKLVKADQAFLASEDGHTSNDVAVKFFTPWANSTWWIVSGTPLDAVNGDPDYETETPADWHLFGFVDLGMPECAELGYVLLSELEEIKGPAGLRVERDMHYKGTLSDVQARYH